MIQKECRDCLETKDINFFHKRSDSLDGYRNSCKECHYNKTKIANKKWCSKDSSKIIMKNNNEKYWKLNKENLVIKRKEYYQDNREELLLQKKEYYKDNREIIIQKNINYVNNRVENDILFKFKKSLRSTISKSLSSKGYKKNTKTTNILGCPIGEFRLYIESKFEDWMTWENKGLYNGELNYGWDIDHIIPVSSVDSEEDVIKLNHYSNLQPLCSKVNRDIKKDKIDYK